MSKPKTGTTEKAKTKQPTELQKLHMTSYDDLRTEADRLGLTFTEDTPKADLARMIHDANQKAKLEAPEGEDTEPASPQVGSTGDGAVAENATPVFNAVEDAAAAHKATLLKMFSAYDEKAAAHVAGQIGKSIYELTTPEKLAEAAVAFMQANPRVQLDLPLLVPEGMKPEEFLPGLAPSEEERAAIEKAARDPIVISAAMWNMVLTRLTVLEQDRDNRLKAVEKSLAKLHGVQAHRNTVHGSVDNLGTIDDLKMT